MATLCFIKYITRASAEVIETLKKGNGYLETLNIIGHYQKKTLIVGSDCLKKEVQLDPWERVGKRRQSGLGRVQGP